MLYITLGIFVTLISIVLLVIYITSDKVQRLDLKGKNIILTGGTDGLGLELSKQLTIHGANVVMIGRSPSKMASALEAVKEVSKSTRFSGFTGDVSDETSIQKAIAQSVEFFNGRIDVLVNNAGITRPGRFDDLEPSIFHQIMKVNFFGHVNTIKAILPTMKSQGHGRIVGVASFLSLTGCMGYSAYAPTKAAIRSLYETLQQEYYNDNINFSVAVPTSIGTASFYNEEQKIKPKETLELEKSDPILQTDVVAKGIVSGIENWKFFINPAGFNGEFALLTCSGFAPFSFIEGVKQVFLSGLARFFGTFAYNYEAKKISIAVRRKEKNE